MDSHMIRQLESLGQFELLDRLVENVDYNPQNIEALFADVEDTAQEVLIFDNNISTEELELIILDS